LPDLLRKTDSCAHALERHGLTFGHTLNVGSKNRRLTKECINFDVVEGPEVDVVGDAHELSSYFPLETFDTVALCAVLQYCKDPRRVLEHAERVLKPGGVLLIDAPFLQPYCYDGPDLWRFTADGLRELCPPKCRVLEISVAIPCGPALAFASQTALRGSGTSLASLIVFSCASLVLWPLKHLRLSNLETAGALLLIARKVA
jgi:SAM-dependent methyltransferase